MTIPEPVKRFFDFVLALPSTTDKSSAMSVRALKHLGPEIRFYNCNECNDGVLKLRRIGTQVWGGCTSCGHQVDFDLDEALCEWGPAIRRANAGEPAFSHRTATRLTEGQSSAPGPRKTEERSRICNMRWANATVLLGDTDFVRCRFFNCKLIDDGPFSMERCLMENCTIQSRDSHEKTSTPVRSVR